jgi:hypothetical protein
MSKREDERRKKKMKKQEQQDDDERLTRLPACQMIDWMKPNTLCDFNQCVVDHYDQKQTQTQTQPIHAKSPSDPVRETRLESVGHKHNPRAWKMRMKNQNITFNRTRRKANRLNKASQ